jgi:hypothetical protein
MKKFSVLSLVVALFAATTVFGQEEQASPSDAVAVQAEPTVEAQATSETVVQGAEAPVVESAVMPMEGQIVGSTMGAPMVSGVNNGCCCGSVQPMMMQPQVVSQPMTSVINQPIVNQVAPSVVSQPMASQPCCGQAVAAPMMSTGCNGCVSSTPVFRVRRPILRRTRARGCCN